MSKQVIESFSPEDTFAFGVELGKKCKQIGRAHV